MYIPVSLISNLPHAVAKSQSALSFFPMEKAPSPVKEYCPLDKVIDIAMKCTGLIEEASSVQPEQDVLNVMLMLKL